jgi:hypothetical protein
MTKFFKQKLPLLSFFIMSLNFPSLIKAEPWIDTSDLLLRTKIQLLADQGYIKTPVTSFPLMWVDIARDLKSINQTQLNHQNEQAFNYVQHQLKLAKRNQKTLRVNAATEQTRFTSFGDDFRNKNNIQLSTSFMTDSFALKMMPSYSTSPLNNDDKKQLDGSYAAAFIGNWVLSIGKQDRWWGPGWDSNLSLTNNARPISAIALSRKSAQPLSIPFTEIKVPWTVSSFMGIMDDERIINDTLLWGFRLNFKPFENLEIGITRLAQWGGDNRSQDASTFWNVLIGKDNCGAGGLNCGINKSQEPGNQQAGYDLRYSFNLYDTPLAIYGQYFAEDGSDKNSLSFLSEPQVQIGFDGHVSIFTKPATIFVEYSDTFADCRDSDNINIGNCFYEHHIYQTGMRYHQRTLGSLYDNDATTLVIGSVLQIQTNTNLTVKLRLLELNKDNSDKAPNNILIGNPLTKIAEDILMLSTKLQHSYKNWRYTIGSDISTSQYQNAIKKKNNVNIFFNVEYNL